MDSLFDFNENTNTPERLTLSQLTNRVAGAVNSNPALRNVWIIAELSDVHVRNHCYLELIEKDARGATTSKLRATIWASTFAALRRKFIDATGKDIMTGLKVCVCCTVGFHPLYGLSANITDIDPSYTMGDLERLRLEILRKLTDEGVINVNKNTNLCPAPQRIAIVSAAGAAGYGDFINQLDGNDQGFVFYHRLFPAVMQGASTSESIRAALEEIESTIDLWDCVVIIRGGGSTSDLNGFDDLELARAVALFPIPVIVGIGHERDRTVLDEIAHTRCKTPTAVAAFLVDRLSATYTEICRLTRLITTLAVERLNGDKRQLATIEGVIPALVKSHTERAHSRLTLLGGMVPGLAQRHVELGLRNCSELQRRMTDSLAMQISSQRRRLEAIEGMVNALSPQATLRRGYTLTYSRGRVVRSASDVAPGQTVTTMTSQGSFDSRVE